MARANMRTTASQGRTSPATSRTATRAASRPTRRTQDITTFARLWLNWANTTAIATMQAGTTRQFMRVWATRTLPKRHRGGLHAGSFQKTGTQRTVKRAHLVSATVTAPPGAATATSSAPQRGLSLTRQPRSRRPAPEWWPRV